MTDENDNVVQTLDFYPYGATRISSAISTRERRQFIGRFTDDSSLSYLNARYYASDRGQFLSEDPMFLGNPKDQSLSDPQSLNSYSYSEDNPITKKDPTGRTSALIPGQGFVYDYNSTNESVCCSASNGNNGSKNVSFLPPPGTANGYLPSSVYNHFGPQWTPTIGPAAPAAGVPGLAGLVAGARNVNKYPFDNLPGNTVVCRWGPCGVQDFVNGAEEVGPDGSLSGVSVQVGINGETAEEMMQSIPATFNGVAGFTTLEDLKSASINIVQQGNTASHGLISQEGPSAAENMKEIFEEGLLYLEENAGDLIQ